MSEFIADWAETKLGIANKEITNETVATDKIFFMIDFLSERSDI